jgi:hypothetical protein
VALTTSRPGLTFPRRASAPAAEVPIAAVSGQVVAMIWFSGMSPAIVVTVARCIIRQR